MSLHRISVREDSKMKCFVRGNKLWITYYVDKVKQRKSTGLDNTASNRKIIEKEWIPKLATKIATGEIYKTKPKTFRYYGDIFLNNKAKYIRAYHLKSAYYQRVIDYFGDTPIDKITRLNIKQYLDSLAMKSKSKCVYKSCIHEVFELAVDDEVIRSNPASNIRLPREDKTQIQYFQKDEVEKILGVATGIMKPYLMLAFNTGMRPEELLGLHFTDIIDNTINITRVRTKGRVDKPKTKNSYRRIPIASNIVEAVRKLKGESLYVFGDNLDDAGKLRKKWSRVLKDANLEHKKLSCSRHTFATHMLKDGVVKINELSGLLGHSSSKVTLTHYASVIESDDVKLEKDFVLFGHNMDTVNNKDSQNAHRTGDCINKVQL